MRHFTDAELLQLITDDESDRVEFKEALSGSAPERLGKTFVLLLTTYQAMENRDSFLSV